MKKKIIMIEHKEVLEKFHTGLTERDIELITDLTKKGYWVFLECHNDDWDRVIDWHVYNHCEGRLGQLMSGTDFEQFKQNNYEPED